MKTIFPLWQTEKVIDVKRQAQLKRQIGVAPDIRRGIYPFKGMRLDRADVEWLLSFHQGGPVVWTDTADRARVGLDLRGADLQKVNLSGLPLARLVGGVDIQPGITTEQRQEAAVNLRGANLRGAHLEGAILYNAHLEGAALQGASLQEAQMQWARLEGANLREADLRGANLAKTHLEGVSLRKAQVANLNLSGAFLDAGSNLQASFEPDAPVDFADIDWGGVKLMDVAWARVCVAEEVRALQSHSVADLQKALRTNRQLTLALQAQGMQEDGARFACRAKVLERKALWQQHLWGKWLLSWILAASSGYGYKPGRCLIMYLGTVLLFTCVHLVLSAVSGTPETVWSALAVSVQALHGRIFAFGSDPQTILNTIEAFVGLFVEALLISVFTQRILGGQ